MNRCQIELLPTFTVFSTYFSGYKWFTENNCSVHSNNLVVRVNNGRLWIRWAAKRFIPTNQWCLWSVSMVRISSENAALASHASDIVCSTTSWVTSIRKYFMLPNYTPKRQWMIHFPSPGNLMRSRQSFFYRFLGFQQCSFVFHGASTFWKLILMCVSLLDHIERITQLIFW